MRVSASGSSLTDESEGAHSKASLLNNCPPILRRVALGRPKAPRDKARGARCQASAVQSGGQGGR